MRKLFEKLAGKAAAFAGLAALTAVMTLGSAVPVFAIDTGTYTVTVIPKYRDPETGVIEDPGNNEAVGQGMCERMCGSTGLLEVEASGDMYLTVRYYLSSFVHDPTFEERTGGGSFGPAIDYQVMQVVDPVEGAKNIEDKYGYTDFRLKINSLDSVFRGKAYIDPPGKHVVYYFTAKDPAAGSGDFITSGNAQPETAAPTASAGAQTYDSAKSVMGDILENQASGDGDSYEEDGDTASEEPYEENSGVTSQGSSRTNTNTNGSGSTDDPVTGIPKRPKNLVSLVTGETKAEEPETDVSSGAEQDEDLSLRTKYDLSSVDLKKAHKLADPVLEKAAGISGTTQGVELKLDGSKKSSRDTRVSANKLMMIILLLIGGGLLIWFFIVQIRQKRQRDMDEEDLPDPEEGEEEDE